MSQKIYVGNMNYSTNEDGLTNLFAQYGEVTSTVIIKDKFTEQSKGFGFVEMADAQAADAAIAVLNGKELDGRRLRVNIAEEKPRQNKHHSNNRDGNRSFHRDSSQDYRW